MGGKWISLDSLISRAFGAGKRDGRRGRALGAATYMDVGNGGRGGIRRPSRLWPEALCPIRERVTSDSLRFDPLSRIRERVRSCHASPR